MHVCLELTVTEIPELAQPSTSKVGDTSESEEEPETPAGPILTMAEANEQVESLKLFLSSVDDMPPEYIVHLEEIR